MPLTDEKIVFVTGASRSGTTLLSFVLRNHSDIFGLREMHYFGDSWNPHTPPVQMSRDQMVEFASKAIARQEKGILLDAQNTEHFSRATKFVDSLAKDECDSASFFVALTNELSRSAGKTINCEQTPRNIFYARDLLRIYPNARVVHMLRDPRAIMASQKKRWQRRSLATDKSNYPLMQSLRVWVNYHPYTISKLWCAATRAANDLEDHPRFMAIKFEDLLAQPENTIRSICDHIDVDFESPMLEVGQVNSSHQSSVGGARKGIHTDAIETWRKVLTDNETAITERICGPQMEARNYVLSGAKAHWGELRHKFSYVLHAAGVLAINPRRAWIQFNALLKRQPSPPQESTNDELSVNKSADILRKAER